MIVVSVAAGVVTDITLPIGARPDLGAQSACEIEAQFQRPCDFGSASELLLSVTRRTPCGR
jgi:hypothetical protein